MGPFLSQSPSPDLPSHCQAPASDNAKPQPQTALAPEQAPGMMSQAKAPALVPI